MKLQFKPNSYTPEDLCNKFNEYFEYMKTQIWNKTDAIKSGDMAGETIYIPVKTPLSRKGFCIFANISEDTLRNYASNKEAYTQYFDLCTRALDIIDNNQIEGAIVGVYNANIVARINGIKEQSDHTTNGKEINTTPIINLSVNSSRSNFAHSEDEVDA
jgi:hypothetical protein